MTARPQIRMLRTMCSQIDKLVGENEYGDFLLAGAKLFRDIMCRTADQLAMEDAELAERLLPKPSDPTYDPKGKGGTNGRK